MTKGKGLCTFESLEFRLSGEVFLFRNIGSRAEGQKGGGPGSGGMGGGWGNTVLQFYRGGKILLYSSTREIQQMRNKSLNFLS